MNPTGPEIVAEARSWIGTPWMHQASLKGVGADCIGLIVGVAEAFKMPEAPAWKADRRFSGYGPTPVVDKLLAACAVYLDPVKVESATLGDILLFTYLKQPVHFGIVSETSPRFSVVHAYGPVRRVTENPIDEKWRARVAHAFRYRGKA